MLAHMCPTNFRDEDILYSCAPRADFGCYEQDRSLHRHFSRDSTAEGAFHCIQNALDVKMTSSSIEEVMSVMMPENI